MRSDFSINLVSGGIAGMCAVSATHPLERMKLIKILGINQGETQGGVLGQIYKSTRTHGLRNQFRGNSVSVCREIPKAALTFYLYETFKSQFSGSSKTGDLDLKTRVLSGASAGIIANSVMYLLDPVRTVMTSDVNGRLGSLTQVMKHMYRR